MFRGTYIIWFPKKDIKSPYGKGEVVNVEENMHKQLQHKEMLSQTIFC